jgi:hypothetical protein
MEAGVNSVTGDAPSPNCPLREAVLGRYADAAQALASEEALGLDELLGFLRNIDRHDLRPLQGLLVQTEAVGNPALPPVEQIAILEWVGEAFELWRKHYPLEQPLSDRLRELQPLAAALALSEPSFLIPGTHPFHQLLDSIQDYAVGWQPSLGRAGNTLEKQVEAAVKQAGGWFDNRGTDLAAICAEVATTAERDISRAQRMSQRVMDTEQGRLRAADAKNTAARMINQALENFQVPVAVGEFLKGPWYESAQLVLLKFTADSEQWAQMTAATESLLDSMQVDGPQGDKRRQYLFEAVTRIPKELKRWLLSLQHDSDAANEAVQPIEVCHLRILRELALDLVSMEPLAVAEDSVPETGAVPEEVAALMVGQWFRIENEPGQALRAQLALKLENERQLLFSNQSGVKSLQLDYLHLQQLLVNRRAVLLQHGSSFTRSLARAAGIESDQELGELVATAKERAQQYEEQVREEALRLEREHQRLQDEANQQAAERAGEQRADEQTAMAEPGTANGDDHNSSTKKHDTAVALSGSDKSEGLSLQQEAALLAERSSAAKHVKQASTATPTGQEDAGQTADDAGTVEQQAPGSTQAESVQDRTAPGGAGESTLDLNLPMGAWLGFHDGEAPLMAKLAVHDPELDIYIFVNRQGIKMRQLSRAELESLVDDGMVDILTTNSNFRSEVSRVRGTDRE